MSVTNLLCTRALAQWGARVILFDMGGHPPRTESRDRDSEPVPCVWAPKANKNPEGGVIEI